MTNAISDQKMPEMQTEIFHIFVPGQTKLTKIAVHHWLPTQQTDMTQTPVVCAHGLTRTGRDFDPLAADLARSGRHVFCVDFPGRGSSDDLVDAKDYNYATYQNMMMHLIVHACKKTDAKELEIQGIGTSMGGVLLSNTAAMDQAAVTACVDAMTLNLQQAKLPESEQIIAKAMIKDLEAYKETKVGNGLLRSFVCNDVGGEIGREGIIRIAGYIKKFPTFDDKTQAKDFLMSIYSGAGSWGPMTEQEKLDLAGKSLRMTKEGKYTFGYDPRIVEAFAVPEKGGIPMWAVWEKMRVPVLLFRGENSDLLSQGDAEKMRDYQALYGKGPKSVHLIIAPNTGHAPALFLKDQIDAVVLYTNDRAAFEKNLTPKTFRKITAQAVMCV